jgi:hypothetical protein
MGTKFTSAQATRPVLILLDDLLAPNPDVMVVQTISPSSPVFWRRGRGFASATEASLPLVTRLPRSFSFPQGAQVATTTEKSDKGAEQLRRSAPLPGYGVAILSTTCCW